MPAIQRSNVVFPTPLGADIRQISPAATDRLSGANKGATAVLASASERENEALVTCNMKFYLYGLISVRVRPRLLLDNIIDYDGTKLLLRDCRRATIMTLRNSSVLAKTPRPFIASLRLLLIAFFLTAIASTHLRADSFAELTRMARGQTVYFNAWGGSPSINAYIGWVGEQLKQRYDITLVHVKLTDTSEAVSRILAEKVAGKSSGGSVDLIWVNGENFASMKRDGLLRTDEWAFELPSFAYTDSKALPAILSDFAVPTEGQESPWGRAQLVFAYDSRYVETPPRSAIDLADWIGANPGRFSFPQPPDFTGTSFLKQIALELAPDRSVFMRPAEDAYKDAALQPLWQWLEKVYPALWRGGISYPANYTDMVQLLGDGELSFAMAFNPAEFSNGIASGVLPETVRSYIHQSGTLANVHFVAIPFNASASEAARVTADFLLSPEAQIRKARADIWGDPTVLALHRLPKDMQKAFTGMARGPATLSEAELGRTLPEPHPSWVAVIEEGWNRRFLLR